MTEKMIKPGASAPLFKTKSIPDDAPFSLSSCSGSVTLLVFSGLNWCIPCIEHLPVLIDVWRRLHSEPRALNFKMAMIAKPVGYLPYDEEEATLTSIIKKYDIPFPLLQDRDTKISDEYGMTSVPRLAIISPDLKVCRAEHAISLTADEIIKMLFSCGLRASNFGERLYQLPDWWREVLRNVLPPPAPFSKDDSDRLQPRLKAKRDIFVGLAIDEFLQVAAGESEMARAIRKHALDLARKGIDSLEADSSIPD